MARLKIVRQDGSVLEGEITPAVEYAFEQYTKMGFHQEPSEIKKKNSRMSIG
jgi:hypothetical protein